MRKVFIKVILFLIILFPLNVNAFAETSEYIVENDSVNIVDRVSNFDGNLNILADGDGDLGDLMPSGNTHKCDKAISEKIKGYWKYIMLLTPLILIVMITIDFVKAFTSGDSDSIKKSTSNAITRVIAGIVLLALPWVIKVVFTWFGIEQFLCF